MTARRRKFCRSDFEVGKLVGEGRFGNVYVAKYLPDSRIVCLKRLVKEDIRKENLLNQVRREVEIHNRLKHSNIIELYGYFHDEEYIYLVEEFASSGELFKILKKRKRFSDQLTSKCIRQIASALSHIHEMGILHRDIKPENILVMSDGTLKLGDFGYVVQISGDIRGRRSTRCGTLDYFSPEMINGYKYDESVDIWALGVLTYELLVGKAPFYDKKENITLKRIRKAKLEFPSYVGDEARDFVRKLLVKEEYRRMSAKQALKHPFLANRRD